MKDIYFPTRGKILITGVLEAIFNYFLVIKVKKTIVIYNIIFYLWKTLIGQLLKEICERCINNFNVDEKNHILSIQYKVVCRSKD